MINHLGFFKLFNMKLKFIILTLLLGHLGFSQNSKTKKAHKLYDAKSYIKAAELYEEVRKNGEILERLADCYYFNGMMDKAVKRYTDALQFLNEEQSKQIYFKLAHSLYGIANNKDADSIMKLYKTKDINTLKLKEVLKMGVPFYYDVKLITSGNMPGDFGVNYHNDHISFTSLRNKGSKTYKWNEAPYLDIFEATYDRESSSLKNIKAFPPSINSSNHESNAILSKDHNTIYFSRTTNKRTKINDTKIAVVKIYEAQKKENEWIDVKELPFSDDSYSILHPALSPDGSKLYFSSDMPGGHGSFDLYYVDVAKEGTFSSPINLGPSINTQHREQFPFISADSTLYFSSSGLIGFGGLDIFMCEVDKDSNTFNTPLNLGEYINTGKDDFSFVVNSEDNTGFLSSNRSGEDNMYHFQREKNDRTYIVEGTVIDVNSQLILPNTIVTLFDENDTFVERMTVGPDGKYKFYTKPNSSYRIEGFKPLFIPKDILFTTKDSGRIELDIELELESYDDAEDIVVEIDGYVFIQLENIYFDLDKWNIEQQAATTLNVLVDLMKKYNRMEVQLGAHTDTRSTYDYNLVLSNNRAKAAMEYLISKGINKSRLTSIGYGETQLLVNCGNECSEDEHSINRRCEFIITK